MNSDMIKCLSNLFQNAIGTLPFRDTPLCAITKHLNSGSAKHVTKLTSNDKQHYILLIDLTCHTAIDLSLIHI